MIEVLQPLTKNECELWIAALRSGEYEQGGGVLKSVKNEYCCLGVLVDTIPIKGFTLDNQCYIRDYSDDGVCLKLPYSTQMTLSDLNDVKGKSFQQIADYIEQEILPTL